MADDKSDIRRTIEQAYQARQAAQAAQRRTATTSTEHPPEHVKPEKRRQPRRERAMIPAREMPRAVFWTMTSTLIIWTIIIGYLGAREGKWNVTLLSPLVVVFGLPVAIAGVYVRYLFVWLNYRFFWLLTGLSFVFSLLVAIAGLLNLWRLPL